MTGGGDGADLVKVGGELVAGSQNETLASSSQVLDGPSILFVDLDGTVRHGFDELGHFVNGPDDVVIFGEAIERLREWKARGGVTIGVTNQAGVARGFMSVEACSAALNRTVDACAGTLDTVLSCLHDVEAGCFCRKPRAGLLIRGALWVEQVVGRDVDRTRCLMVGDRDEDAGAAISAGVRFQWAADWRAGK